MGRKYDTRNVITSEQSGSDDNTNKGTNRRVPIDDRERVQQRLSSAIAAVREEMEQTAESDNTETATTSSKGDTPDEEQLNRVRREHRETLDQMAGIIDGQQGYARTNPEAQSLEGNPMVELPGDDEGKKGDSNGIEIGDDDMSGISRSIGGENTGTGANVRVGTDSAESDTTIQSISENEPSTTLRDSSDREVGDSEDTVGESGSPHINAEDVSPAELAHKHLCKEAVASRYQTGKDNEQRAIPAEETKDNRIGGWNGYDPSSAVKKVSLDEHGEKGGITQKYMDRVVLENEVDGTDTAFVTYYNTESRPNVSDDPPKKSLAQSQMGMYAFCDAVGVDIPRHTYNTDEEWVTSYGIDGYSVSDLEISIDISKEESREIAQNIDREEFRDQMAVQILGGNSDLHLLNVYIDDGGGVHCIDLDRGTRELRSLENTQERAGTAAKTSRKIAKAREEGVDNRDEQFVMEQGEIADRAQEIAVSIHESGDTDRIVNAVAEYDEEFPDTTDAAHRTIRNNIEMLVKAAQDGRAPSSAEQK